MDVDKRFDYIDQTLYPTATYSLWMNFGGPLVSTLVYIFLLPWVTEWVHEWNLGRAQRLAEASRKISGQELLTREESIRCRADRERRVEQVHNLTEQLQKSSSTMAGWRAVSNISRIRNDPTGAVVDFITSQSFKVFGADDPFSNVNVLVSFGRKGDVFVAGSSAIGDADNWTVSEYFLLLHGEGGAIVDTFELSTDRGTFISMATGMELAPTIFNPDAG